jgi:hypothetical protein
VSATPGGPASAANLPGDAVDLESRKRAASLALKQLKDQLDRGEVDEDLKRQLGVTDDDLRDFARRLEERLAETGDGETPEARDRQRQFEEMLRGIDYGSTGARREASTQPREAAGGAAGVRRPAPAEYRDQERKLRERATGQQP